MKPNGPYKEWYFQSDYDLETAIDMMNSGRNVYCIFMCHLSIEKALKGLFTTYTKIRTESILTQTKEMQSWIKAQ